MSNFEFHHFPKESGRDCAKLVEPAGLTVSREFEIPWKKQTLDLAELAFLRFEEKLGSRADYRAHGLTTLDRDQCDSSLGKRMGRTVIVVRF